MQTGWLQRYCRLVQRQNSFELMGWTVKELRFFQRGGIILLTVLVLKDRCRNSQTWWWCCDDVGLVCSFQTSVACQWLVLPGAKQQNATDDWLNSSSWPRPWPTSEHSRKSTSKSFSKLSDSSDSSINVDLNLTVMLWHDFQQVSIIAGKCGTILHKAAEQKPPF